MDLKKYILKKIKASLKKEAYETLNKKEFAERLTQDLVRENEFKKHIELQKTQDIQDDLQAEVYEALQKITYGTFSLKEYYDSQKKNKK